MSEPSSQRVAMKDLARLAGCSVMTVSLALRGSPRVSAARRDAIQELARIHGYRVNPLVSALVVQRRTGRSSGAENLALLTKLGRPVTTGKVRVPFYSALWDGVRERAGELGFSIEEFVTRGVGLDEGRRLTRIFKARGIRGILLFPSGDVRQPFPSLDWEHFSTVAISFHMKDLPVHRTASDYAGGMSECLAQAGKRGYQRIGLAMTKAMDPTVNFALSGRFFAWQQTQPKSRRLPLVEGCGKEAEFAGFENWVNKHKPDLVMTLNAPVELWLHGMGRGVPQDIGVMHLSVRDRPGLAGMDHHSHALGQSAVNVLARELFLNRNGLPDMPELILTLGSWQEGNTIRSVIA